MNIREKQLLQQDISLFKREVQNIYKKFDRQFGLNGANLPMKITFDEEILLKSIHPASESIGLPKISSK